MSAVAPSVLSSRWTPLRPHATQQAYWLSPHRFNVVPAGRRSGKTELAKRKIVLRAMSATTDWSPRFFAGAPTRDQAKRIFWDDIKALCKGFIAESPAESDLTVSLFNGATITVVGMDKPERIEGSPWDGGVLDEFANTKETAWTHHLRPALSDRKGWCDFTGVPEGRNHFAELSASAQALMQEHGAASEWGHFHWVSADILDAAEIESARRSLDPLTFAQEYEASFVNFEGRAYYPFNRDTHCAPLQYDANKPLILCFDFNTSPGVAAIIQEQVLPKQFMKAVDPQGKPTGAIALGRDGKPTPIIGTGVIGEVHIPRNSNTPAVCRKIINDWGQHRGQVIAYGDATGGNKGTAKVMGSDWDLIKSDMTAHFGARFSMRVKDANPPERSRVNAVNTRLINGAGEISMMVDGAKCPQVVKDFEGVATLKGGSGEIDKKRDDTISHLSDGIGYYVDKEFPIVRPFFGVSPLRG